MALQAPVITPRRRTSWAALSSIVLLASLSMLSCGNDKFRVIPGMESAGSRSSEVDPGESSGGSALCCDGGAPGSGGDESGSSGAAQGSGGNAAAVFEGACELSVKYCAVDWVGSWDEAGFDEGVGEQAELMDVSGVTSNGGTLYVTHAHGVSSVDIDSREVTLIAGANDAGDKDARGDDARFDHPTGIAYHDGFLYVSDTGNRKIRRIDLATNSVSTYTTQLVSGPAGLEILPADGNEPAYLLIADEILHIIVRVEIAEFAPTPGVLTGSHGTSGSNSVQLNAPYGLARAGRLLFITERGNHWVRSIDLSKPAPISLEHVWGTGEAGFSEAEGEARLNSPTGIAKDGANLLVVDTENSVIRRGLPGKVLSVVAGEAGQEEHVQGVGQEARFSGPLLIHTTESGDAFLAEGTVVRRLAL